MTFLAASPDRRTLAAGYANGVIQIYDLETHDVVSVFAGHKSAITALIYDEEGYRLASGAKVGLVAGCVLFLICHHSKYEFISRIPT